LIFRNIIILIRILASFQFRSLNQYFLGQVILAFLVLYLFYAGFFAGLLTLSLETKSGMIPYFSLLYSNHLIFYFLGVLWGYLVLFAVCVVVLVGALVYRWNKEKIRNENGDDVQIQLVYVNYYIELRVEFELELGA